MRSACLAALAALFYAVPAHATFGIDCRGPGATPDVTIEFGSEPTPYHVTIGGRWPVDAGQAGRFRVSGLPVTGNAFAFRIVTDQRFVVATIRLNGLPKGGYAGTMQLRGRTHRLRCDEGG